MKSIKPRVYANKRGSVIEKLIRVFRRKSADSSAVYLSFTFSHLLTIRGRQIHLVAKKIQQ